MDTVKSETSWKDENSIFKGNLLDGPEFACQLSPAVYKVRLVPSFTTIPHAAPNYNTALQTVRQSAGGAWVPLLCYGMGWIALARLLALIPTELSEFGMVSR